MGYDDASAFRDPISRGKEQIVLPLLHIFNLLGHAKVPDQNLKLTFLALCNDRHQPFVLAGKLHILLKLK